MEHLFVEILTESLDNFIPYAHKPNLCIQNHSAFVFQS